MTVAIAGGFAFALEGQANSRIAGLHGTRGPLWSGDALERRRDCWPDGVGICIRDRDGLGIEAIRNQRRGLVQALSSVSS
jgi:hypothetical protein